MTSQVLSIHSTARATTAAAVVAALLARRRQQDKRKARAHVNVHAHAKAHAPAIPSFPRAMTQVRRGVANLQIRSDPPVPLSRTLVSRWNLSSDAVLDGLFDEAPLKGAQ